MTMSALFGFVRRIAGSYTIPNGAFLWQLLTATPDVLELFALRLLLYPQHLVQVFAHHRGTLSLPDWSEWQTCSLEFGVVTTSYLIEALRARVSPPSKVH
jgi:hypothetical protein